jgi:mannitol/fructose-specific phosphotransferase system IIA component (Ntr-type)
MRLIDYTDRRFIRQLTATDKYAAIEELAHTFLDSGVCADIDKLVTALKEREDIMTTGIGFGIAVPHARIKEVRKISFAIGTSRQGIHFDAIDRKPAHLIILVAAGDMQHMEYLRLLSKIMNLLKRENTKESLIAAATADQIIDILKTA